MLSSTSSSGPAQGAFEAWDAGGNGSELGPSPGLEFGTRLVIRPRGQAVWVETVVLAKVFQAPWSFVVLDAQSELFRVDLSSDDIEYIVEDQEDVSATLLLEQSGEPISLFAHHGGVPSWEDLAFARDEGLAALQEARVSLRGGSTDAVLPLRRRLRRKTKDTQGQHGLRKNVGLAGSAGAPAQSTGSPLADDECWVLASIRPGMHLGQVCVPSSSAVFLHNKCLDTDNAAGVPFLLDKVKIERVGHFERDTVAEWRTYMGQLTPQEDAAAGGPRPSDGISKLLENITIDDPDTSRYLSIESTAGGLRSRDIKEYATTFKEANFEGWPLQGPRTVLWCLLFVLAQTGGGFTARVQSFMNLAKLSFSDGNMTEYSLIARVLEMGLTWDQLNIANLACMELLARRFQLIEEKYRHRLPQQDGKNSMDPESDAGLFLGLGSASSFGRLAVCVMPALSEYIGNELGKEAAISKGKVKAHQLREDIKKMNQTGGGGKKGSGSGAHADT